MAKAEEDIDDMMEIPVCPRPAKLRITDLPEPLLCRRCDSHGPLDPTTAQPNPRRPATMLVSLTVGKVDAGVAVLLTEDKRLASHDNCGLRNQKPAVY